MLATAIRLMGGMASILAPLMREIWAGNWPPRACLPAFTLQGWGSEGLLNSYSAERRPVFQSAANDFIEAFIRRDRAFVQRYDPERDKNAFEEAWNARTTKAAANIHASSPHYEGSPVVYGPPNGVSSARGSHVFAARAGHHLPPQPLSSGQNVFEALGMGFSLLAFDIADDVIAAGK